MPMTLPDVTGMSNADAAETYARHGFHITPVRPGTKAPYLDRWPERATCDLDTVRDHWRGHPDDGIATHVGGCGLLVIDVDDPTLVPAWMWLLLAQAVFRPTTSDPNSRRGHYFYRLCPGQIFGCGRGGLKPPNGEAAGFDVKCLGGAIVLGPTDHPRANEGGHYATGPAGLLPFVPDEIAAKLNPAETNGKCRLLTPAELDEKAQTFLSAYTDDDEPQALARILRHFDSRPGERHTTIFEALCWAMREAKAGRFPAQLAVNALQKLWNQATRGREDEFNRAVRDAIARADAESVDELRARTHGFSDIETYRNAMAAFENGTGWWLTLIDADLPANDEAFWTSCQELHDLRQFARSRRVGPWAMFAVCAAVVVSSVPPYVVLPPLVGHYAPLNLFVALVGKSGSIKSAAIRAAFDWLNVNPPPNTKKPGSGEGLAKCFAYVKKPKGEPAIQIGKHWSVFAEIPEVDTLTATGGRGGSTLMSELRSAWSGERLGIDYAADDKAITLHAHRYRMCMIVGVQPLRAAPIFEDADAGTPQRFVWFPVSDPDRPKERPEEPPPLDLPAWPGLFADNDDEGVVHFDRNDVLASRMGDRADASEFRVLDVPDAVYTAVDEQAFAVLGDDANIDPLDGHKLLCREKIAAAIALLRQNDGITEHDWELAGIAMRVSDRTRADVLLTLKAEAAERNRSAGQAAGVRKMAEAEKIAHERTKKLARIAERIVEKLCAKNDQTLNELKKQFGPDKQYVDEALSDLEDDGRITKHPIEYRGREGFRIHLNSEDRSWWS
jgi:hypothetical protein